MEQLFKICAAVLVCLVLVLVLEQHQRHIVTLICIVVCCAVAAASVTFFQDIIQMVRRLQRIAGLDTVVLSALMKSVTVAVVCEITSMLCTESGYGSIGKILQFLGVAMILYFSLPLLEMFFELVSDMLGGL